MTHVRLQTIIGATSITSVAYGLSAVTIKYAKTCTEYFDAGGFCISDPDELRVLKDFNAECDQSTGCTRDKCCSKGYVDLGEIYAAANKKTCGEWKEEGGKCQAGVLEYKASDTEIEDTFYTYKDGAAASSDGDVNDLKTYVPMTACCKELESLIKCNGGRSLCSGSTTWEDDNKICDGSECTEDTCCAKPAGNCGEWSLGHSCSEYEHELEASTTCSLATCTSGDCCLANNGIGKCETYFEDKKCSTDLPVHKHTDTRCLATECKQDECCEKYPTCATFDTCPATQTRTHATTKTCTSSPCKAEDCCVDTDTCEAIDCSPGTTLLASPPAHCQGATCEQSECCTKSSGSNVPKQKTQQCASFDGCKGEDAKGRKYTGKVDGTTACEPDTGCTDETCCTFADDATCFPGDAEVFVKDGYTSRVADLRSDMAVWGHGVLEPVLGLLHLHSDMQFAAAHATATSA